jgi:ATP-dependent RNA helicase DHX57
MGIFTKGRPVSAGGTGQPPAAPKWQQQLAKVAGGGNPLLSGAGGGGMGGGGGGGGGGGSAPLTGYGAVASSSAAARSFLAGGGSFGAVGGSSGGAGRSDGYWGAKPGTAASYGGGGGGSSSQMMQQDGGANKRKYADVWAPNQQTGFTGRQPKAPKPAKSNKPKKVEGSTADGSPWHPPLRRVTVAQPALRAMRAAVDAPAPPGLLEESDVHTVSSVPDLAYLDRKAREKEHHGRAVQGCHSIEPRVESAVGII